MDVTDSLKLENQLCFPLYALSRLVTRAYQPYLEKLEITYPQYLVLLVLWETQEPMSVNDITHRLVLNTNTVTPLLKRMHQQGLVVRERDTDDERKMLITLSDKGLGMKKLALSIPQEMAKNMLNGPLSMGELMTLKGSLCQLIEYLDKRPD